MLLNVDNAAQWMKERGLLTAADVVDGRVLITDAGRRNRNLKVTRGPTASGYVIKQAPDGGLGRTSTIAAEASFYRSSTTDPGMAAVRPTVPALVQYVESSQVLVIELLPDAVPLWAFWTSDESIADRTAAARLLGSALAALHGSTPAPRNDSAWLRPAPPWILGVHRPAARVFEHISPANLRALRILQQNPDVCRSLTDLHDNWRSSAPIHNDVKSDNLLVWKSGDEVQLRIVDWELIQQGDPLWDVAGAFCDVWVHWIAAIPLASSKDMEEALKEGRHQLSAFFPAVRAFWSAYRQQALTGREQWDAMLQRAIRYAAARLIQSAYEQSQDAIDLPNASVVMLQVAANVLTDPESAQLHLLGIPPSLTLALQS